MKILYHHRVGSKDGQYVHIEEMINAFRELGHEVIVSGPKFVSVEKYGDESRLIGRLKKAIPAFMYEIVELLYSFIDLYHFRKAAKAVRPDLIYERYNLYFISGVLYRKFTKIPLFLEVNAPLFEERSKYGNLRNKRLARKIENYTWNNADHVFSVTKVLAGKIAAAGVDEANITVTPNGINQREFALENDDAYYKSKLGLEGKTVLGFVGFVRTWHGLDRVLDLLARYDSDKFHLLIVGDGPACEELRAQARNYNIENQLTITGPVERAFIKNYIAAFDVALQPSVVEYASPLKLFEYMALGKAIVAPDQDNIREILTHDVNTLLFDVSDERGLTDSINKLLGDETLRKRLGDGAVNTIRDRKLTWENNAQVVTQKFLETSKA